MTKKEPCIYDGSTFIDDRGQLSCFNTNILGPADIKRFYVVENFSTDTVRAFHGHQWEEKFVLVVSGSALFITAEMDQGSLINPSKFVLSSRMPQVLHVPGGYANGFRMLEYDTRILFFSTATLAESIADDFRFPWSRFGEDFWEVANR
jgi:dTDP-4-dehydrorhamnose 3,5-epimerase-like enzyme